MGSKHRKKKAKLHLRKILVTMIIIAIGTYISYAIFNLIKEPTDIVMVEEGKLYEEESAIGYIIRDETIVSRREL